MYDDIIEHTARVERLQQTTPTVIHTAKLNALLDAVRNREMTVEDITRFTNITSEQLLVMLANGE